MTVDVAKLSDADLAILNDPDAFWRMRTFTFTDRHRELLRKIVLWWIPFESGAPMVQAERPYGSEAPLEDIGRVFGTRNQSEQVQIHAGLEKALRHFLEHADLAPGSYALKDLSLETLIDNCTFEDGEPDPEELGIGADGRIAVDGDMIKLVKGAKLHTDFGGGLSREPSMCMRDGFPDTLPVPVFDSKRPYGNYTDVPSAMWEIVDWPLEGVAANGRPTLSDAQYEDLLDRHRRLLACMQVFLQRAELP